MLNIHLAHLTWALKASQSLGHSCADSLPCCRAGSGPRAAASAGLAGAVPSPASAQISIRRSGGCQVQLAETGRSGFDKSTFSRSRHIALWAGMQLPLEARQADRCTWHWLLRIAALSSLAVFWRCEMSMRSATGLLRVSSKARSAIVRSAIAVSIQIASALHPVSRTEPDADWSVNYMLEKE